MADKKKEKALLKKALGYDAKEIIEESGEVDGDVKLLKRKVTIKNVPPDVTAIKMITDGAKDLSELTDEELEEEKGKLLKLIKNKEI